MSLLRRGCEERSGSGGRLAPPQLPEIADRLQLNATETIPGVLNRALRTRVLLLQADGAAATAWPEPWLEAAQQHDAGYGIALAFEGIDARFPGSGRLEQVDDCQLWLNAAGLALGDAAAVELVRHVLRCGGSVTEARMDSHSGNVRLQALEIDAVSTPVRPASSRAGSLWSRDPALVLADVLAVLPAAQRFQGRIALLIQIAREVMWQAEEPDDRHAALRSGMALYVELSRRVDESYACATLSVLIGAVRARNTLDNRLRNMPNDRLGLLLLVAVARLGSRARAFTLREICRELGAVATGT